MTGPVPNADAVHRRHGAWRVVAYAVLAWLVTTFPAVHLRQLQARNHLAGSVSAHPALFTAYVWRSVWTTAVLSVAGPALLWAVPRRLKRDGFALFAWSIGIGVASAAVLFALTASGFGLVSDKALAPGTFVYSGLVAGVLVGELHRRALRPWPGGGEAGERRQDYVVAAVMIWAVLLQLPADFVLSTAQPGDATTSPHFAMWLSVALWTPWIAGRFWKHAPHNLVTSIARSAVAGVVFPLLVSTVLLVPATALLYAGLLMPYQMTWAYLMVVAGIRPWGPLLYVALGMTWGVSVGVLRWRYRRARADGATGKAPLPVTA